MSSYDTSISLLDLKSFEKVWVQKIEEAPVIFVAVFFNFEVPNERIYQ
jgi:hypothetical protein